MTIQEKISFIVLGIIFYIIFYAITGQRKKRRIAFKSVSIQSDIPIVFIFHLKNTIMKQVKFLDTAAAGKHTTTTGTLKPNSAGNIPPTVEGSAIATSSDDSVVVAEVGEINQETGKYSVKANYTGKAGSAIVTLSVSPDLDNSGDAPISFSVLHEISVEEASGFQDDDTLEVGELED